MTYHPQRITITAAQIVAIAQRIADDNPQSLDGQYTPEQWQAATEHWLRTRINSLLVDVEWHARSDFEIEPTCQGDGASCRQAPLPHSIYCRYHSDQAVEDEATGRTVPVAPTVAPRHGNGDIMQRRRLEPEPDGDILWA